MHGLTARRVQARAFEINAMQEAMESAKYV